MPENPYQQLFDAQISRHLEIGRTTAKERISKLRALRRALEVEFRQEIREALRADFRKPFLETDLTEIYPTVSEIRHAERNLREWMKPQKTGQPLPLVGSRSYIIRESKGVCLILSPWNFPLYLTFGPLVSAIAAGNCVILKPSEWTPATSQLMEKIVRSLFDPSEVTLVQGEVATAQALLELPFHHIFFTGSSAVGKIVMKAASKHLSSITLELGGKSPAFVDESVSMETAAKRLAWGKCLNAGQICVAPDYVLVTEKAKAPLIASLKKQFHSFYPEGASASDSYARIINDKHHQRLTESLEEATKAGARIIHGGGSEARTRYLEPTLIDNLPEDSRLMQEEIFGPILPIITVSGASEAIEYINRKERPLALYIYSRDNKAIRRINEQTRAGGGCINHNVVHLSNHQLPFGGINNSGIGKSHGFHGFMAFSNERSIVRQYTPSSIDLLLPPYSSLKQKLGDATLKWFK